LLVDELLSRWVFHERLFRTLAALSATAGRRAGTPATTACFPAGATARALPTLGAIASCRLRDGGAGAGAKQLPAWTVLRGLGRARAQTALLRRAARHPDGRPRSTDVNTSNSIAYRLASTRCADLRLCQKRSARQDQQRGAEGVKD
jgi:hypothetical protein